MIEIPQILPSNPTPLYGRPVSSGGVSRLRTTRLQDHAPVGVVTAGGAGRRSAVGLRYTDAEPTLVDHGEVVEALLDEEADDPVRVEDKVGPVRRVVADDGEQARELGAPGHNQLSPKTRARKQGQLTWFVRFSANAFGGSSVGQTALCGTGAVDMLCVV